MLKWLRQLFSKSRTPDSQTSNGHSSLSRNEPEAVVKFVFTVDEKDELGCDDCFELLDRYADMLMTGGDAEKMLPEVERHLTECPCCEAELRALIVIAEQATAVG